MASSSRSQRLTKSLKVVVSLVAQSAAALALIYVLGGMRGTAPAEWLEIQAPALGIMRELDRWERTIVDRALRQAFTP